MPNVNMPQGTNVLAAQYSGDSTYLATTYQTTFYWGVPTGWSAATTTATVNPGDTATYNLMLTSSGFSGTATISCVPGMDPFATNPTSTVPGAQCSVSPTTANLTSGGPGVPVTVTITTTAQSRLIPSPFHALPFTAPPVMAFLVLGVRRRKVRAVLGCLLLVLLIGGISSCGGGGGTTVVTGPPATNGIFSVWAGTVASSNSNETVYDGAKLTLNVNP